MPRLTRDFLVPTLLTSVLLASAGVLAKDLGPQSAACDGFAKTTAAWRACAERTPASAGPAAADAQHFYAGYWLAKNGRYEEALLQLNKASIKNARVLTYIGFATRKLGQIDKAMGYYAQALQKDPHNHIARSYLGEAHLARNDLAAATAELARIEAGCGKNCDAYTELAAQIADYRTQASGRSKSERVS